MNDKTRDDRGGKPRGRGDRGSGSSGGGARKPFRPKASRSDASGESKPFKPRSYGMLSHGGAEARGDGKPKSYGRVAAKASDGGKPRTLGDEAARGRSGGAAFGKRRERSEERPRAGERSERTPGNGRRDEGGRSRGFEGRGRDDRRSEPGERVPKSAPRTSRPPRRVEAEAEDAAGMRIAKRLARAGIASRRDAEGMIADGRVKVNGKVLDTPAVTVTAADRIEIDGAPLPAIERTRLWLFHKPAGLVTTNRDPEGRPTVFGRLPKDMPRVLSVGRLDINTEGLLLLTNDGGLARTLELPATGWLRRYRVRAHGTVKQAQLDELRQGIAIDGVFYGAVEAALEREQGSNVWLSVGLREGKNREVKRILGHLGLEVNRLIRVSFGPFQLADLEEGAVREIKGRTLRDQLGERLIEESGADFDAPVTTPFSNKAVATDKTADAANPPKSRSEWISSSEGATTGSRGKPDRPERPNKKRFGEEKRTKALERLDTKPGRGRFGDRREADDQADRPSAPKRPGPGRRHANVWMAPGARPGGGGKRPRPQEPAGEGQGRSADAPRSAPKGRSASQRPERRDDARGPKGDRPTTRGPRRPRSQD
ncbi:pseudouridine synthase [Consotaella aegiceratis]|uniref:pseudouridine synthase n=1 Tax=Consotaella aegiceratis TaxID=3097961 RepID=UPI002F408DFD